MKRFFMAFVAFAVAGALYVLFCVTATAQSSPLEVRVVDQNGYPVNVLGIGCVVTDDPAPANYTYWSRCTNCSTAYCDLTSVRPYKGAYFIPNGVSWSYTSTPEAEVYGVYPSSQAPPDEMQVFVLWPSTLFPAEWVVTFTVTIPPTPTPTPSPTPAPSPTPTPFPQPASVNVYEGFGSAFQQSYGQLSSHGILPDFGADVSQWLWAGRKWIQFINQGNLLYVLCAILLAVLVINWAIERVKNPR